MWAGLGYYRRGRLLLQGAQLVQSSPDYSGVIPSDREKLRSIPGIGEYTSAAIASIGFGKPVAAMDANLVRVLTRIKGIHSNTESHRANEEGEALITCCEEAKLRPGCLNQALMELGARVCQAKCVKNCLSIAKYTFYSH